jgi:hypothetical protein
MKLTKEDINRINSQYLNDCENTGEMEEIFALAIQALEQEPILDKIRAEIDEVYEELDGCDPDSLGTFACRIDDILDKYKADSED